MSKYIVAILGFSLFPICIFYLHNHNENARENDTAITKLTKRVDIMEESHNKELANSEQSNRENEKDPLSRGVKIALRSILSEKNAIIPLNKGAVITKTEDKEHAIEHNQKPIAGENPTLIHDDWETFFINCIKSVSESDAKFFREGIPVSAKELSARMQIKYDLAKGQTKNIAAILAMMTFSNSFFVHGAQPKPYEVEENGNRIKLYDWLKNKFNIKTLPGEPPLKGSSVLH